ncbi:MAG: flagellar motor protein MotB [Tepidisphaerales bacterium]
MNTWIRAAAVTAGVVWLTGCVAQEKYNALRLDRDRLAEQLAASQAEASAARAEAESLRQTLAIIRSSGEGAQQIIANLTSQNAELQRQLDELNRRYAEALGRPAGSPALPPALDNALKDLAAANPEILEFDSEKGVLRFKADVTFASGDATLTPRGAEVVRRFAAILNRDARGFEFIVAGHTDNVRVANPETIRRGHKDNWYLSAHRAITVAQALINENVQPTRMGITGYAEYRPVAPNTTEQGRARNRRVEVLILPTTIRLAPSPGTATPAGAGGVK